MQSLKTVSVIVFKLLGKVKVFHAGAEDMTIAVSFPDFPPSKLKISHARSNI